MGATVISGSERYYQYVFGKLLKHYRVTCWSCHKSKLLIGKQREVVGTLKRLGWGLTSAGVWCCPAHVREVEEFGIGDDE